jgi:heme A synthase
VDVRVWRLSLGLCLATFVLLLVGGTVNPTGSSLACPDWPTCYGTFFPKMEGGVLFEHSHRIVATLVGLLTTALTLATWRGRRQDPGARGLTQLALALVIVQGLLGGITVRYRLPTAVSTAHLALALLFFSLTVYLAFRLHPERPNPIAAGAVAGRAAAGVAASTALLVYAQMVLGALVRHTGAGRICPDIPFCNGEVWPAWAPGQLHMAHRILGVLLFFVVAAASAVLLRVTRGEGPTAARLGGFLAPIVALLQISVAVWMVETGVLWVPAMLHLGVGALLLLVLVGAAIDLGRRSDAARERGRA